jgi:hypothetical protein
MVAAALLTVGAAGGALRWRRFGPARAPSGPGTLVVSSAPPGAHISVDGRAFIEVSPTVVQLDPGHHVVEARLPHYLPFKLEHDVRAAASEVLRLPLQRDTYKMVVTSDPTGATVILDGFTLGDTPTTLEVDPLDPHTLRLDRLGRRPWETLIPEGERKHEIHATLKKADAE